MSIPAADHLDRRRRLTESFAQAQIDSMLITNPIHVTYLSGFSGDSSYLWVRGDGQTIILSDGRYDAQIRDECTGIEAEIRPSEMTISELVGQTLRGSDRVGVEADNLTVAQFESLSQRQGIGWQTTAGIVSELRTIKDAGEIAILGEAVRIAEEAIAAVGLDPAAPKAFPTGMTERGLAFALENEMRIRGAAKASFNPIVAVDAGGALPHYSPRDVPLAGAKTLLVDWGAMYLGYASDMTRTYTNGDPPADFVAAYEACLAARQAAIDAIAPGVAAQDVHAATYSALEQRGWAKYFVHSTGHGIGLEVHEAPRLGGKQSAKLAAGMVVTVEPGVYLDGHWGIRIEDDVLITADGGSVIGGNIPLGLEANALIR